MTFQKHQVSGGRRRGAGLGEGCRQERREHGFHSGEGRIQGKEGDSQRNHVRRTEAVGSRTGWGEELPLKRRKTPHSEPRESGSWGALEVV